MVGMNIIAVFLVVTDQPAESNKVHTDDGKLRSLSWDVLEVNRYLMDGLNGCDLDRWFDGEGENRVPSTTPDDLRAPRVRKPLAQVMKEARAAIEEPAPPPWEAHADLKDLDRNLEQLIKEIAKACQTVFSKAGTSVGQTAAVDKQWTAPSSKGKEKELETFRMRERTVVENEVATQYVLVSVPRRGERLGHLCLTRMQFRIGTPLGDPTSMQIAPISCRVDAGNESTTVDVLDFEFFDEESIVLVLKPTGGESRGESPAFVGTMAYRDLEFTQLDAGPKLGELSREKLVHDVIVGGEHARNALRLTGTRKLCLRSTARASVTVNGRVGRRTVCVLDGKGGEVEVLDMAETDGSSASSMEE
ncbi:hypothetical protein K439DRAFT_607126 [Ramaria rubella]|nr:hypothetical protein K439DRAFT_607126 [Ramaria rubella]